MQLQLIDWTVLVAYGLVTLISLGVLFTRRAGCDLEQYFPFGSQDAVVAARRFVGAFFNITIMATVNAGERALTRDLVAIPVPGHRPDLHNRH
jgi:hypothetical protein